MRFRNLVISWVIFFVIGILLGLLLSATVKAVQAPVDDIQTINTPESTSDPMQEPTERVTSLGKYRLTAYCPCKECCDKWAKNRPIDDKGNPLVITASGAYALEGVTIAADTSILPFGTTVLIDGHEYIVQDSGGAIKGNRIDIYFESHQEALNFGVQYKEIFIERMNEK